MINEVGMFGLEDQKKKKEKTDEFVFELEQELKNKGNFAKIKSKIEDRIRLVKETLRSGECKEEFDRYGMLLHGYTAVLKIMGRLNTKR